MRLFGLIGYPLGHSFSQQYFSEKFVREGITDAQYELFPIRAIGDLVQVLQEQPALCGLSVTIPYKELVLPFLNDLDETACAVGAVNCIRIQDGRLTGYNTDVYGFEQSLRKSLGVVHPSSRALLLGTGGASKAVAFVLRKMGIDYQFVSRKADAEKGWLNYDDLRELDWQNYHLVVNTTPLGTYPKTDGCPDLPFEKLSAQHLVFDLVYNPPQTVLLRHAMEQSARVQNGLDMLQLQAEKAWEIWQQ
jgi:shikimate dehydrogenase